MVKRLVGIGAILLISISLSCDLKRSPAKEEASSPVPSSENVSEDANQRAAGDVSETLAPSDILANDLAAESLDLSKSITGEMIEGMTLRQLWLARNEIFAKKGRPFKNYELNAFFQSRGMMPDRDFSEDRLTDLDRKNIEVLLRREKELLENNYLVDENTKTRKGISPGNILNLFQYGEFTEDQIDRLKRDGFFVSPASHAQFFHLYEKNDYLGIPSFITTDSVLQLYSITFDSILAKIETDFLNKKLESLTRKLAEEASRLENQAADEKLKRAARIVLAYALVPNVLLTENDSQLPESVKDVVQQELALVRAHEGYELQPILVASNRPFYEPLRVSEERKKYWMDYSLFQPRGHYTRTEPLKRYFLASLWLGAYPLHFQEPELEEELLAGLLLTSLIQEMKDTWEVIYETTAFFAGMSDDLGTRDVVEVDRKVFGEDRSLTRFSDAENLKKCRDMLLAKYEEKTRIRHRYAVLAGGDDVVVKEVSPQFKLMGQRYTPDSEIFQRLVWQKDLMNARIFPKGLDAMAVFGSELAKDLMMTTYRKDWEKGFPQYPEELEKLKAQFEGMGAAEWNQNLYFSWLWTLKPLLVHPDGLEQPYFAGTAAWTGKDLNTALASWTELRHHTILYSKQSAFAAAECGGGEEEEWLWVPEPPKGYVEPNREFYGRLIGLVEDMRDRLTARRLIDKDIGSILDGIIESASFLDEASRKELEGEPLTLQEHEQIRRFGSLLESLTLNLLRIRNGDPGRVTPQQMEEVLVKDKGGYWSQIPAQDRSILLIADVHTGWSPTFQRVLEEAVGYANEIYVVVEIDGQLKLTRGAVFSQYEFTWPAEDRLTDEKWMSMLYKKQEPSLPEWTKMFLTKDRHVVDQPLYLPKLKDFPSWPEKTPRHTPNPGWILFRYDTGC